jgi:hypothetical protein
VLFHGGQGWSASEIHSTIGQHLIRDASCWCRVRRQVALRSMRKSR